MMRYKFGLGVGHTYTHHDERAADGNHGVVRDGEASESGVLDSSQAAAFGAGSDSEDSSDNYDDDDLDDQEVNFVDHSDDEEFFALNEMYSY